MRYFLLLILFANGSVTAQSFAVTWNFNGNTNFSSNSAQVSANSASLTGTNESGYPTGCTGNSWAVYGWKSTFQNDEYMEVAVTPVAGYQFSLSNISINLFRTASGPTNIYLRSNQDGFANDIATGSVPTNCGAFGAGLSFNNISSTVRFRFHTSGTSAGLGNIKFDDLVISGTVSPVALPVLLSTFRATPQKNRIEIVWETVWEKNSDYFEVQRSQNARTFETLTSQNAIGNSTERNQYTFTDHNPPMGLLYYRLKQVDFDGNSQYSKVIVLKTESTLERFFVENPVKNQTIVLQGLDHFDTLILLNSEGKEIEVSIEKTNAFIKVSPKYTQTAGVYFLRVELAGDFVNKQLVFE